MTAGAGGWVAATASVRGASHERSGKPNQDAVRVVQVDGPNPGLVAAVCDGHGGDRYVRSDVGSRLGVEVACSVARRMLESLGPQPKLAAVEAHLTGTVAPAIVERWRERVMAEVERHPFTDEERTRAGSPLDADPFVSYGCTLVLAVLSRSWVGLLQIGDGDATVVRDASAESPIPGDDRLIGGETTSLCLPTAVADARVAALGLPLPETLILTSDGYANSFASTTWRTDVGLDLQDHIRRIGIDGIESRLPGWLADSAIAAGDDVTMALLHRSVAVEKERATVVGRGGARAAAAPPTPRASGHRRSVAIAAVAIVSGTAFGWGLAQLGQDDSTTNVEAAPTTASSSPTTTPSSTSTPISVPPTSDSRAASPIPTTDTPPSTALALDPNEHVVWLYGASEGLVLAFNPNSLNPQVRLISRVDGHGPALGDGWELMEGQLRLRGAPIGPARAAGRSFSPYVWALSDDCTTLVAYETDSGDRAADQVTISNVDGKTAPVCDALASTGAAGTSQESVEGVGQDATPGNSEPNGGGS